MNSNSRARTLDLFVGASGEKLTRKELKRSMKEVGAAVLLRRRRVSSPAMMAVAVRLRFACGSVVMSEKTKERRWNRRDNRWAARRNLWAPEDSRCGLTARTISAAVSADRKSTRLNSSHSGESRMPSSA